MYLILILSAFSISYIFNCEMVDRVIVFGAILSRLKLVKLSSDDAKQDNNAIMHFKN